MLYSLMADTAARAISGAAYIGTHEQRWCVAKHGHHDVHTHCYKLSQLLGNHAKSVFTKHGTRARGCMARDITITILANCYSPTTKNTELKRCQ